LELTAFPNPSEETIMQINAQAVFTIPNISLASESERIAHGLGISIVEIPEINSYTNYFDYQNEVFSLILEALIN
jgi:hypothetical protein